MKYMLDTNVCIGLIRQKPRYLIHRLTQCEPGEVGVSSITIAELMYGVQKSSQQEQNAAALEKFLLPLAIADFDQSASAVYGFVRATLERQGQVIGAMDMLIGAHALSLDAILVTNNCSEFMRIADLTVEDWMA